MAGVVQPFYIVVGDRDDVFDAGVVAFVDVDVGFDRKRHVCFEGEFVAVDNVRLFVGFEVDAVFGLMEERRVVFCFGDHRLVDVVDRFGADVWLYVLVLRCLRGLQDRVV